MPAFFRVPAPALPSSVTRTALRTSSVAVSYPRRWATPADIRVATM
jgi:hypothetical protein